MPRWRVERPAIRLIVKQSRQSIPTLEHDYEPRRAYAERLDADGNVLSEAVGKMSNRWKRRAQGG